MSSGLDILRIHIKPNLSIIENNKSDFGRFFLKNGRYVYFAFVPGIN